MKTSGEPGVALLTAGPRTSKCPAWRHAHRLVNAGRPGRSNPRRGGATSESAIHSEAVRRAGSDGSRVGIASPPVSFSDQDPSDFKTCDLAKRLEPQTAGYKHRDNNCEHREVGRSVRPQQSVRAESVKAHAVQPNHGKATAPAVERALYSVLASPDQGSLNLVPLFRKYDNTL